MKNLDHAEQAARPNGTYRALWLGWLLLGLSALGGVAGFSLQAPEVALYVGTVNGTLTEDIPAEVLVLDDGAWRSQLRLSVPKGRSLKIQDLAAFGRRLYAATLSTSGAAFGQGLYYTEGTTWQRDAGISESQVNALSVVGERLYVGVFGGLFVLKATGGAPSWAFRRVAPYAVNRVVAFGQALYAGTHGGGVYLSADQGGSWARVDGLPEDVNVWTLTAFAGGLYLGTYTGEFYRSADGAVWDRLPLEAAQGCARLAPFRGQLVALAGDECTLYRSPDGEAFEEVETGLIFLRVLEAVESAGGARLYVGAGPALRFSEDLVEWTALPPLPRGAVSALGVFP